MTSKETPPAPTIGVLAGMGPRSTAPFIDMLVTQCQRQYGARDDMDFPRMHIISLPTPFYPGREIDRALMIKCLRSGITDLVNVGAAFIAVPCNLAHAYFDDMRAAAEGVDILHIADCAVDRLPDTARRVALLATRPTLSSGIYAHRLHEAGKDVVHSPAIDEMTASLIAGIKASGYRDQQVLALWRDLQNELERSAAEAVLVACTDISPLLVEPSRRFSIIDTAESLAIETISKYVGILNA
ncbi:aspartate/glutamate racemase family protein [Martelella alba]|uniref:Aspartate racemase n=1 Tax=Martelella alba TaxID=2590451 RepID=A0ABY2SJP4_9HYPH|nr:aspartate/glutamate racemase family protein [Martelella alba]TKI05229.1 aspartate racemase [Martelella alba]